VGQFGELRSGRLEARDTWDRWDKWDGGTESGQVRGPFATTTFGATFHSHPEAPAHGI
jgi:hypothetical protein